MFDKCCGITARQSTNVVLQKWKYPPQDHADIDTCVSAYKSVYLTHIAKTFGMYIAQEIWKFMDVQQLSEPVRFSIKNNTLWNRTTIKLGDFSLSNGTRIIWRALGTLLVDLMAGSFSAFRFKPLKKGLVLNTQDSKRKWFNEHCYYAPPNIGMYWNCYYHVVTIDIKDPGEMSVFINGEKTMYQRSGWNGGGRTTIRESRQDGLYPIYHNLNKIKSINLGVHRHSGSEGPVFCERLIILPNFKDLSVGR